MPEQPSFWSTLGEHWEIARTLRKLEIHFDPDRCTGVWECYEVCPVGCWTPNRDQRVAIFHNSELCVACGACVRQCPNDAIVLE